MRSILITGVNGFVGQGIGKRLLADGFKVRGIGRADRSWDERIDYLSLDLLESTSGAAINLEDIDAVVHTAAAIPGRSNDYSANLKMTSNLLLMMEAHGIRDLVHISSSSVYGSRSGHRKETDQTNPDNPYGTSKLACEKLILQLAESGSLSGCRILRFANVFGQGMPNTNSLSRMSTAVGARRFVGLGSGANRKSFLHIEDAVDVVRSLLSYPNEGIEVMNVSTGDLTLFEVTAALAKRQSLPVPRWVGFISPGLLASALSRIPLQPAKSLGQSLASFASEDILDVTRLTATGFTPKISLRERIEETASIARMVHE